MAKSRLPSFKGIIFKGIISFDIFDLTPINLSKENY